MLLLLEDLVERMREYQIADIAEECMVSWNTVQQIRRGHNKNPTYMTYLRLCQFIAEQEQEEEHDE